MAVLVLASCQASKSLNGIVSRPKPNEGPCPAALVLWDAARKVQISKPEVYSNVGFTGEVTGVRSFCTYVGTDPIVADLEIDFAFGRGPAAQGQELEAPYFIAITRKDRAIITKEVFPLHIKFRGDQEVTYHTEKIASISIPRKQQDTSGANFEIIVGFDLSEDELAFARSGKRFRVDAGSR
jgi:hypothetical protein